MKKYGNDQKNEMRLKLMGMGERSMRKNYYRELVERQNLLEQKNKELEKEIEKREAAEIALKKVNAELENQVEERTKRLNALSRLVQSISHEINTPLGVSVTAISYLERLIDRLRLILEDEAFTAFDFESIDRDMMKTLTVLTKNIYKSVKVMEDFNGIIDHQPHSYPEFFDVYEVLDQTIKTFESEFDIRDHVIDLICPQELVIKSYPSVLGEVLYHLMTNAYVHGLNGKGHIQIKFKQENEHYILICSDNGRGIDASILPHIFDPFYSGRFGQTTGLGLFRVYTLVHKQLHGSIGVVSEVDHGTTFTVKIPE